MGACVDHMGADWVRLGLVERLQGLVEAIWGLYEGLSGQG